MYCIGNESDIYRDWFKYVAKNTSAKSLLKALTYVIICPVHGVLLQAVPHDVAAHQGV